MNPSRDSAGAAAIENNGRARFALPALFAAFLLLGFVAARVLPGSWLSTLVAVALWPLLAAGCFFFFASLVPWLRRGPAVAHWPTLAVAGLLIGSQIVTYVFLLREKLSLHAMPQSLVAAALAILAALGLFAVKPLVCKGETDRRATMAAAAVVLAIFAWFYGVEYIWLQDYPLGNLFAQIHVMKGAMEFARFDRLNPFVTGSYTPVNQVFSGLGIHILGLDILKREWLSPLVFAVPLVATLYALSRNLFATTRGRLVFLALAFALYHPAIPTNGALCTLAALTIASLLLEGKEPNWKVEMLCGGAAIAALLLGRALFPQEEIYLLTLIALSLAVGLASLLGAGLYRFALIVTLSLTAATLHRSAILFIPAAVVFGISKPLMLLLLESIRLRAGTAYRGLIAAILLLPMPILVLAAWPVVAHYGLLPKVEMLSSSIELIDMILPGNVADTLAFGAGSTLAALNLLRVLPLSLWLLSIALGGLLAYRMLRPDRGIGNTTGTGNTTGESHAFIWLWLCGFGLAVLILSGIPYTYRTSFLAAIVLAGAVAHGLSRLDVSLGRGPNGQHLANALALAAFAVAAASAAGLLFVLPHVDADLALFRPLVLPVTLAGLGVCALLLLVYLVARAWRPQVLTMLIVAVIALDQTATRFALLPYSFGVPQQPLEQSISHYTREELDQARRLRATLPPNSLIFSDPYTVSLVRAHTGLSAIYNYANLATVVTGANWVEELMTLLIRQELPAEQRHALFCRMGQIMVSQLGGKSQYAQRQFQGIPAALTESGEVELRWRRPWARVEPNNKTLDKSDLDLSLTESQNSDSVSRKAEKWQLAIVLSERSRLWRIEQGTEQSLYFPPRGRLDPAWVAERFAPPFKILSRPGQALTVIGTNCFEGSQDSE